MAILKPKRGSGLPTSLQQNELAVDVLNKRIYLGNAGGTGDIVSSHITDYVATLNGATGILTISGGTGISVLSPTETQKGITLINSGVVSFNGLTGSVTGVTTGNANTFVQLQTFTSGISGNGATFSSYLNALNFRAARVGGDEGGQIDFDLPATNTSLTGGVALDIYQNRVRIFETGGTNRGVFIDLTGVSSGVGTNLIGGGGAVSSVSGSGSGILVSPTTGAVVIQNTGVVSFNSTTGAIQGVSTAVAGSGISVSGATGNVTITNIGVTGIQGGTGIGVSSTTGNPTIRNTGVLSVNGSTGTITNVALTNTAQTFTALQSFSSGISSAGGTFTALTRFTSGLSASGATFGPTVNIGNTAATTNIFLRGLSNIINCPNGFLTITTGQTASGLNIEDASGNNTTIKPATHKIDFYDQFDGDTVTLNAGLVVGAGSYTVSLPSYGTTLAGLGGEQTFTGLKSFSVGLSASGISSGSYILTPSGIKALTGTTYTFLSSDNGTVLTHNNSSGCTFTVPTGLPVGYSTTVLQLNSAGTVRFIAASGVTLNAFNNFYSMAGQHASASLISYTTNIFNLSGNLI